jgi:chromosome segregation ATPase
VTKAEQALEFANKAADALHTKQQLAADMLAEIEAAVMKSEHSKAAADKAYNAALAAAQQANTTRDKLDGLLKQINDYLAEERATPAQVRQLAQDILGTTISLTPEQIRSLGEQISSNLSKLENIDSILAETRGNLSVAQALKRKADVARERAEKIRNTTSQVIDALAKAKAAQTKAHSAIEQANKDIDTAEVDLTTVMSVCVRTSKRGVNACRLRPKTRLLNCRRHNQTTVYWT